MEAVCDELHPDALARPKRLLKAPVRQDTTACCTFSSKSYFNIKHM
jgi:hypothetical protein